MENYKWKMQSFLPKGLFSLSQATGLRSGGLQVFVQRVQGWVQQNRTEANRSDVAEGDALSSVCGCSTICLHFWWAKQHLSKGSTSSERTGGSGSVLGGTRLMRLVTLGICDPCSCSHQPRSSSKLSTKDEASRFPEAARTGHMVQTWRNLLIL